MSTSNNESRGAVAWMAKHHVAANILMVIFIAGGWIFASQVKQEVFPEFSIDLVTISVPYLGAGPEEVEQGIVLSIEDQVRGLDGVKNVTSRALEGAGSISVEVLGGADPQRVLQDVKNAVDSTQSFPVLAERPVVSLAVQRNQVLSLILHGPYDKRTLRDMAEKVRDDLLQLPEITLVELDALPRVEIAVEVPQATLRAYGKTLPGISRDITNTALELPAGALRTEAGEVLLRTQERRDYALEYEDIPFAMTPNGSVVTLGDVATIRDTFEETDQEAFFNGEPAVRIQVYRVGKETPQSVSKAVRSYLAEAEPDLPAELGATIWEDNSEVYRERMQLLVKNAVLGLFLVMLILGLFLDPKLAFWVTLGIPISIMGSFLFLPFTGASINMISLFAFIVTLGIVVDDAVVMGENIYEWRQRGVSFLRAAILGAREIAGPIVFAVLTNVVAFMPLFFVPGAAGNLFRQIPSITVAVFIVSLIESIFILPSHLSHAGSESLFWKVISLPSKAFSRFLAFLIRGTYEPTVRVLARNRYATCAGAVAMLMLAIGIVAGGHLQFSFLPRIEQDVVSAQATLTFGVPVERSREVQAQILAAAHAAVDEFTDGETDRSSVVRGIYTQIGSVLPAGVGAPPVMFGANGSHVVGVQVWLAAAGDRDFGSADFAAEWRAAVGPVPGLENMTFTSEVEAGGGADIEIELSHRSTETLEAAAAELAKSLEQYAGVEDIDDGFARGKPQLSLRVKPEAQSLGITAAELASQVRGAFFGAEALRQQRGRDEVRVLVRLPAEERGTSHTLEQLVIRTPQGGEVSLLDAATIEEGFSYTDIRRRNGRRTISVTGNVDREVTNSNTVLASVLEGDLPPLLQKYPGLGYSLEGAQASQRESLGALAVGFPIAMIVIYGLLAIPFGSYIQPVIVMLSIPFGFIGAVIGHLLLGFGLSLISLFGLIALAGVVVNDSLVLVVTANRARDIDGADPYDAIVYAGTRRFRPILLTSLTTFFGLAPMIFETSMQARFLIPMAISLGFGILFATFIILGLVPAVYLVIHDFQRGLDRLLHAARPAAATAGGSRNGSGGKKERKSIAFHPPTGELKAVTDAPAAESRTQRSLDEPGGVSSPATPSEPKAPSVGP